MIGIERNEIIEELFDSLLQKYQKGVENKKATINPKNYGGKCFQYAITVALNHKNIIKDLQRISKIKPFINKSDLKEIDFPSHKNDWKVLKQINCSQYLLRALQYRGNKTCVYFKA